MNMNIIDKTEKLQLLSKHKIQEERWTLPPPNNILN
jgi:hypothetical protein